MCHVWDDIVSDELILFSFWVGMYTPNARGFGYKEYLRLFLLVYQSFATPDEVLNFLWDR
ncbi:hypothetical protein SARC_14796, partial [Sphaeroforma arctica JP610]